MRKPSLGDMIYVEWFDCHSTDSWTHIDDLLQMYDPPVQNCGIYIGRNRSGSWVVLASLLDGEIGGGAWHIPPKMIRRWRKLKTKGAVHE